MQNEFNLINLDGLEALKRQISGTWLGTWVNHIEIYGVWRTSQLFFKLHSHILVLWRFCRIPVISEFSFLDKKAQNENPEITENFYFWIYEVQMHVDLFFDHYFNFLNVKTQIIKKQTQVNKYRGLKISRKT